MRNINIGIWMVLAVPIILIFVVMGFVGIFLGVAHEDSRLLGLGGGILCFMSAYRILDSLLEKKPKADNVRPVVRVWTHNGFTRVVPDLDWRLWHENYERNVAVGLSRLGLRPDPEHRITFCDKPEFNWVTGDMNDYRLLVSGCRVERVEMYVHNSHSRGNVFNLKTAWKMIYGSDSEPPETNTLIK